MSYTVDTLRQLNEELPDAVLFFLMGADAVHDVPHWREPREIFRLATPLVVRRAGQPEPDLAALRAICAANKQPRLIEMPAVDASSTEIRRRAAAGEPLDDLVPQSVAAYIAATAVSIDVNDRSATITRSVTRLLRVNHLGTIFVVRSDPAARCESRSAGRFRVGHARQIDNQRRPRPVLDNAAIALAR